jgi:serine/threonine protein kinase
MKGPIDRTMAEADHLAAFFSALETTQLLEPEQVAELRKQPTAGEQDARPLAELCVEKGWLTNFQVHRLLKGRTKQLMLGPYRLLDRIGEGGMGQVFKAYHRKMNRVVALKFIKAERLKNPQNLRRFKQEIQIAAQLHHPNIVVAYDAGQEGDVHYLAMEYVDGVDLNDLVHESGHLPVGEACDYIRQAALGLQHAHEKGLVHRDIKPGNLLVTRQEAHTGKDKGALVKILDLGLARLGEPDNDTRMTRDGAAMGTPEYMAPEQAVNSRNVDARSDIYSLGCSFYYLLTGRAPFWGKSLAQLLLKHQLERPKPLSDFRNDVPPAVEELLLRLLAKKPGDRPQTAAEVAAALEPFCQGKTRSAETVLAGRAPKTEENHDWDFLNEIDEPTTKASAVDRTAANDSLNNGAKKAPARATQSQAKKRALVFALASGAVSLFVIALLVFLWMRDKSDPRVDSTGRAPKASNPTPERPEDPEKIKEPSVKPPPEPVKTPPDKPPVPPVKAPAPEKPPGGPAVRQFEGGKGPVYALVVTPDGRQVIHAGLVQAIAQRELSTGQVTHFFNGHAAVVHGLALSRDGKRLLSGSWDDSMRLWDVDSAQSVKEFRGHAGWVQSVAFTPDGKRAVSGSNDHSLRLWDLDSGVQLKMVADAHGAGNNVNCIAIAADGRHIISSGGSTVRLWDIDSLQEVGCWHGGTGNIHCVAALPDGQVAAGDDVGLHVVDPIKDEKTLSFLGFLGQVFSIATSPDGDRILTGSGDNTVRLWDRKTGKEIRRFEGHAGFVCSIAFTPGGRQAVSGASDMTVRVWDLPP